jgi:1-acyl-sn-glycerol-3-phosphate acyltransferase
MIPLRRGEPDIAALREGLRRLEHGEIVIIAPEGTRSGDGKLQRAKAGVVPLAIWSGAPLLPLVFYGHEQVGRNIRRLKRSDFHIVVGEPFQLETQGIRVDREVRQAIADEIMGRLARLLPPENRGFYAGSDSSPERYVSPLALTSDLQADRQAVPNIS